ALNLVLDRAEHHLRGRPARVLAQSADELQAVHGRHTPVEQDGVWHDRLAPGHRLHAVGRLGDLEAEVLQDAARDLADHAAVVDDETGLHGRVHAASLEAGYVAVKRLTPG